MELLTIQGGYELEVKTDNSRQTIIKGYGVVFNGRDYVGDTFIKQTQFNTNRIIGTPIFLEHGLEGFKQSIGEVINFGIDDIGMWIEAKIDTSIKLVSEYLEKIRKGLVGWSSGATSHLVERVRNVITRWTVAEFSLTTHPADKRTLGVQVKNISPYLQAILETEQENRKEEIVEGINRSIGINSQIVVNTRVNIKRNGRH
jgi:hypothetical protein